MSPISKVFYPPDLIKAAKAVDLLTWLQATNPARLKRMHGQQYCLTDDPYLILSNGKWNAMGSGFGGKTALQFLMLVEGYEFTAAVGEILAANICPASTFQPVADVSPATTAPRKAFFLPRHSANNDIVIAYLRSRDISDSVIVHCIDRSILYESDKFHSCVFVGKDGSGKPRYAAWRSTSDNKRAEVTGSDKRHSFQMGDRRSNTLLLTEAPIDALSIASIYELRERSWDSLCILSMGGVFRPRKDGTIKIPTSIEAHLAEWTGMRKILLCVDSDDAGLASGTALKEALEATYSGVNATVLPPAQGKDYNDFLRIITSRRSLQRDGGHHFTTPSTEKRSVLR